jgi:aspartate racemase
MAFIPRRKLIGVLGGMGPVATIDFVTKIRNATEASRDQDHIPLIIHDVPQIPDRSTAIQNNSDDPWLPLLSGVRLLERAGADLIAIPCNAAHFWYERLAQATNVRIIHIADATSSSIKLRPQRIRRLALMATLGTVHGAIYTKRMSGIVELMVPEATTQAIIDRAIASLKAGIRGQAKALAEEAGRRLLDLGADALLLACTELPISLENSSLYEFSVDATDALARSCVLAAMNR